MHYCDDTEFFMKDDKHYKATKDWPQIIEVWNATKSPQGFIRVGDYLVINSENGKAIYKMLGFETPEFNAFELVHGTEVDDAPPHACLEAVKP